MKPWSCIQLDRAGIFPHLPGAAGREKDGKWDPGWLVAQHRGRGQQAVGARTPLPGEALRPHLQDAPPLVLLVLGEHVSSEEGEAAEADAVGPVAVVSELSPVVGALGTHHLGDDGQEGLQPAVRQGRAALVPWPGRWGAGEHPQTGGRQSKLRERNGGRDRWSPVLAEAQPGDRGMGGESSGSALPQPGAQELAPLQVPLDSPFVRVALNPRGFPAHPCI